MKRTVTKRIREETVIELDESDIVAMIRVKFDLPPFTEVEFDVHRDMLQGATIRMVTEQEVSE